MTHASIIINWIGEQMPIINVLIVAKISAICMSCVEIPNIAQKQ